MACQEMRTCLNSASVTFVSLTNTVIMKHLYALAFSLCLAIPQLMAQYCSPTFSLGCTLWRNQTIQMGTIDWTLGVTSCTVSDYTSMSTTVDAGTPAQLTVSSGNWTGC